MCLRQLGPVRSLQTVSSAIAELPFCLDERDTGTDELCYFNNAGNMSWGVFAQM